MDAYEEVEIMSAQDIFHVLCNVGPSVSSGRMSEEVRHDVWKLMTIAHDVESLMRVRNVGTVGELFKSLGI